MEAAHSDPVRFAELLSTIREKHPEVERQTNDEDTPETPFWSESLEHALDFEPASFGRVIML